MLTIQPPPPAASAELAEAVAWLPCRRRSAAQVYRSLDPLLRRAAGSQRVHVLVLEDLVQLDGPIVHFILGLEDLVRPARVPIVLADPSGFVPLVLPDLEADPQVRVFRSDRLPARPRPVLIVDLSGPFADVLAGVLDSFDVPHRLAETAREASRLLDEDPDRSVLVDRDHPALRPIADRPGVVGLSFLKEGPGRILPKPASVLDLLDVLVRR
jgi:hypothetical protein